MTNVSNKPAPSSVSWLHMSADGVTDEVVADRGQFATAECRTIFDWWQKYSPNLPARENVPLAEFARLLPDIYLSQLMDDRMFIVRIQGERVKAMLGAHSFPRTFAVDETGFPGIMARNYREAIHRKQVLRHFGTMQIFNRQHVQFESADFPLSGGDSGQPYIFGIIRPF